MKNIPDLTEEQLNNIIALAWCDKTSFEMIYSQTKLNHNQVKYIMKKNLKPSSYRIWRDRVTRVKQNNQRKHKDSYSDG